jgi:hypothetical protein
LNPDGGPIVGLQLIVGGQTTTTDATGSFHVANVTPPYDIVYAFQSQTLVSAFLGVTRKDPIIVEGTGTLRNVSVTYDVSGISGGNTTGTIDHLSSVHLPGSHVLAASATENLHWYGPASLSVDFYAAEYVVDGTGVATQFVGFGSSKAVAITDATPATVNLTLASVQSTTIDGSDTVPAGYVRGARVMGLTAPSGVPPFLTPFTQDTTLGVDTLSSVAPTGVGLVPYFSVTAQKGTAYVTKRLDNPTPGFSLIVPAGSEATQPAQGAVGVPVTQTFTWTAMQGALYQLLLQGSGSDPLYSVWTTDPQAALPDTSALGVSPPNGRAYSWTVNAYGPLTLDDLLDGSPHATTTDVSSSGAVAFTFAP